MNASPYDELREELLFVNIGKGAESFFNWRNANAKLTFNQLDVLGTRSYEGNLSYFIHLKKHGYKLVFREMKHENLGDIGFLFIIGAAVECQYQVIEAFLEYLAQHWFEIYGAEFLQSSSFGEIFDGFSEVVEEGFDEVPQNYLMKVNSRCRLCGKNFDIYVRKSLIDRAESYPAALVFEHADHALLLYIDEHYCTRGESAVDITG